MQNVQNWVYVVQNTVCWLSCECYFFHVSRLPWLTSGIQLPGYLDFYQKFNGTHQKLEEVKVESDDLLVSFDVTSFFPSIPLEKVLISLEKWLTSLSFSKFEISEYVQLTKLCIFQNALKFGENLYIQNNVLAMGNPLSPYLANLWVHLKSISPTHSLGCIKVGTQNKGKESENSYQELKRLL